MTRLSVTLELANGTGTKSVSVAGEFENSKEGLAIVLTEIAGCVIKEPLTISVNPPEPAKPKRERK